MKAHVYQTQTVFPYLRHVFNGNTSIFIKIFCFHACGRLFSTSRILIMIGPQPAIFVFMWSQYFKVSVSRWMNAHVSHTNSVFPYLRHVFNGNASMFIKICCFHACGRLFKTMIGPSQQFYICVIFQYFIGICRL